MKKAKLIRFDSNEQGTFSAFLLEGAFFCYFGELPWRNNLQSISCIPAGTYLCKLTDSPKFGRVYQLQDVPMRTHILIHAGNFSGNESMGFKSDSYGCLLPGSSVGELSHQQAVTASRYTLKKLMDELKGEDFELTIKDCYE